MVNKSFIPSKTAQNGLNFISKDEENNLATNSQPEDIVYLFKLIYLYLGESFEDQTDQTLIGYLVNDLEKKYGVDSLSNLVLY
jgi:hypothetical protein